MKAVQNRINVTSIKKSGGMRVRALQTGIPKISVPKPSAVPVSPFNKSHPAKTPMRPLSPAASAIRDDYSSLKEAALTIQRIKASAQQERDQIRKMRADAIRYQQATATRARSEAHQLILHSRLETQREIEELIRQASEEIQKVLADIRVIRITAQEELAAQRKFTDAAKLTSMSLSIKEELAGTEGKKKRQLVTSKA
jgi:SepF-like predicted cell division protein (DUF552 family)